MNGPAFVGQFETLADGYEQGCLPTSNILDPWEQGRDYFANGQLAMVITDFQDLPKVENAGINYGTTAVPTPDGRRAILLRLVRQRRRHGELGASG